MNSTRSPIKNWRELAVERVQYDHTIGRARPADGSAEYAKIGQKRMQCDHLTVKN